MSISRHDVLKRVGYATLIWVLPLIVVAPVAAQIPHPAEIRIGLIGDPAHQIAWTDEALDRLKTIGFNEVQLNIAWGSRPFGEALNLIDVVTVPGETEPPGVAQTRAELKRRVALAKHHGLRTLFHFGSPYMDRNPYTGEMPRISYDLDNVTSDSWYDILNPKVRDHELALLREFRRQFPDVEDILVYTYDQDAWQTPEFQFNRFSYGVPLSSRLPGYLAALHDVWTSGRPNVRMWWEPWELSAGQVYTVLPQLPRSQFGLIIHANIVEAQLALPADVWFRNTARICHDLGIPVVAESLFSSGTQEAFPRYFPAPRLVDEEYMAFMRVAGVVGIKEYLGINTSQMDPDLDLLQARLRDTTSTTEELLSEITQRYGPAQTDVRAYLGLLADAFQTFPWDASSTVGSVADGPTEHGWSGATIRSMSVDDMTPAWSANRHGEYMKMDNNAEVSFWMLEDVQLRCAATANALDKASALFQGLIDKLSNPQDRTQFRAIQDVADRFRRIARGYALHIRETNVARMLREDLAANRPMTVALAKELGELLDQDIANQEGKGRTVEIRRLYAENPQAFVRRYLIVGKDARTGLNVSGFLEEKKGLTTQ